jgi:hypothetical protein
MQPVGVPAFQFRDWQRPAEQEPLHLIRCAISQVMPLRFGFHPFRASRQAQAFGHGDDGVHSAVATPKSFSDLTALLTALEYSISAPSVNSNSIMRESIPAASMALDTRRTRLPSRN